MARKSKAVKTAQQRAAELNMLTVIVEGCGNPDLSQYAPVAPTRIHMCQSLNGASRICRQFIEEWNLGGGNWGPDAGRVYHPTKGEIAYVSYSGRVWPQGGYAKNVKPIPEDQLELDHTKL